MELTLLGSGGGDCTYQQTPGWNPGWAKDNIPNWDGKLRTDGKNLRYPSMAFLSPDTLIDFSYDGAWQMGRHGLYRFQIKHLLITHSHFDHFDPDTIVNYFLPNKLGPPKGPAIYGNDRVIDQFEAVAKSLGHYSWNPDDCDKFERVRLVPQKEYQLGEMTLIPVKSSHMHKDVRPDCTETPLNFIIQQGGKSLLYAVDSARFSAQTEKFLKGFYFDIVVLDASYGKIEIDPKKSGHMNFDMMRDQIGSLLKDNIITSKTKVIATHLSVTSVREDHDVLSHALQEDNISLGWDGMTIEV